MCSRASCRQAAVDSDRDAELLRFGLEKGWEPGGSGRLLLMEIGGSTRHEDAGYRNSEASFAARYYHRNLGRHLFLATLSALPTRHRDPETQVLLGGDNGMRGYPIRYQAGESRTMGTSNSASSRISIRGDYFAWVGPCSPTRAASAGATRAPHRRSAPSTISARVCAWPRRVRAAATSCTSISPFR